MYLFEHVALPFAHCSQAAAAASAAALPQHCSVYAQSFSEVYPHLRTATDVPSLVKIAEVDWDQVDAAFCCLPHATTQETLAQLPKHIKIVDLSADFRLKNVDTYAEWCDPHRLVPRHCVVAGCTIAYWHSDSHDWLESLHGTACSRSLAMYCAVHFMLHRCLAQASAQLAGCCSAHHQANALACIWENVLRSRAIRADMQCNAGGTRRSRCTSRPHDYLPPEFKSHWGLSCGSLTRKDFCALHVRYGGEHKAKELQKEAVYGLTELHREEIKSARLVANPGCYPTSVQLPLVPLLRVGIIPGRELHDPASNPLAIS